MNKGALPVALNHFKSFSRNWWWHFTSECSVPSVSNYQACFQSANHIRFLLVQKGNALKNTIREIAVILQCNTKQNKTQLKAHYWCKWQCTRQSSVYKYISRTYHWLHRCDRLKFNERCVFRHKLTNCWNATITLEFSLKQFTLYNAYTVNFYLICFIYLSLWCGRPIIHSTQYKK